MTMDPNNKLKAVKRFKRIRSLIIIAILIGAVATIVFGFVIGVCKVSGVSMYPTLENGDFVVFSRLDRVPKYGDVIALQLPTGERYVKRVVALAGDTVDIIGGIFYRNGEPIDDLPTMEEDGSVTYPLTVEKGDVFTLGDNRAESIDSRFYGTVSIRQIRGKIKLRIHGFSVEKLS